jgi:hypothetical protein
MTKTARVYKIEMLIRNRGHVSFQTLLEELEVSPATLKRCPRRSNFDPPCRLNFDPGLVAGIA